MKLLSLKNSFGKNQLLNNELLIETFVSPVIDSYSKQYLFLFLLILGLLLIDYGKIQKWNAMGKILIKQRKSSINIYCCHNIKFNDEISHGFPYLHLDSYYSWLPKFYLQWLLSVLFHQYLSIISFSALGMIYKNRMLYEYFKNMKF